MGKRVLSTLFALCMLLTLLPSTAFAADDDFTIVAGVLTKYNGAGGDVTIPDGVTSIGSKAFFECSSLTGVTIPDSVTSIGERAFLGCTGLTEITLPDGVTSIGDDAFEGCESLTEITIPANAQFTAHKSYFDMDFRMFRKCNSLTAIHVSAGNPYYCSEDGVLFSADKTKLICCPTAKGGTYTIPNGVTSIEAHAFRDCSNLTGLTLSDTVASIGERAFENCSSLTGNITIPNSMTIIGNRVFYGCKSLTGITIPGSITSIGDGAFKLCESLTEVIVPDSVTSIGGDAFYYCIRLTKVTLPDRMSSIGYGAFKQCYALKEINIPAGLTTIAASTFALCRNLAGDITIPNGVTNIGDDAFSECYNITAINIPDSVTSLGGGAFLMCRNLTRVDIPNGVTNIERALFKYCYKLTEIAIPDSVTDIAARAFDSAALTDVYYSGTRAQWHSIHIDSDGNDTLLNAKIHCIDDPTITYNANGGTGTMDSIQLTMSDVYTLPACGFTAPAGKEFKAWSIDGVEHAPGVTLDLTLDTTITAVWKDIDTPVTPPEASDKYRVSYDPNGGTGVMADTLVDPSETYIFPACGFTAPAGKEFKAWELEGQEYAPADGYRIRQDAVVFALWQDSSGPAGGDVNSKLDELIQDLEASGEKIRETLEKLVSGGLLDAIEKIGDTIFDKIEELEKRIQGSATVEVEAGMDFVHTKVSVTGAKLNFDYSKRITLKIGRPVDGNIPVNVPNTHRIYRFSMKLVEGENNNIAELTVPIRITLPVPSRNLKPQTFTLWHYHNGRLSPVELTSAPFRGSDGQWYVTFRLSGFSDFIMTYEESASSNTTSGSGTSAGGLWSPAASGYSISASRGVGGKIAASSSRAVQGATVTITASPAPGYQLQTVVVTDNQGNSIPARKQGDNQYTFTMPASRVNIQAVFVPDTPQSSFADVPANTYYAAAVSWAVEQGVTTGTGAGAFSPNAVCTRAQAVTFLWRAAGSPAPRGGENPFTDVQPGTYYYDAVRWALEQGITTGTSASTFSPDTAVTRGETVTFLHRANGAPAANGGAFRDVPASAYYAAAVSWAVEQGITTGTSADTFSPHSDCTRAQMVTFLYRAD